MINNRFPPGHSSFHHLIADARRQAEAARDLPDRSDRIAAVRAVVTSAGSLNLGPLDHDTLPKELLEHYRITDQVFRGGQGVVCVAIQKSTGRRVAIKIMRDGPFSSREDCLRFEREARILAQLDHPNIVGIIDSGLSRGLLYFVMEYVEGEPLGSWMSSRAGPLVQPNLEKSSARRSFGIHRGRSRSREELDDVVGLFLKVAGAIHAAHLRGVIHRDLKPGNIQVDSAGEPHILDFGMAKVDLDGGDGSALSMTQSGRFFGSLPWASPEQAAGRFTDVDVRSDVYALGVILYQMLTGAFPYSLDGGPANVMSAIQNAEPARVRSRNARIDDELETIVHKCLQKDPARRYQSAGELAEDLRRHRAGEPIAAKRDALPYLIRKAARRYALPLGIAAAFMVLVVSGLIVSVWLWRVAADAEKTATAEAAHARSVNSLLQQILTGSSPYHNSDRELTARELLQDAARKLEVGAADQPEVEARARMTLGAAFFGIGHPKEAAQQLTTALTMWTDLRGEESAEMAETLGLLSLVRLVEVDRDEAESLARRALDMSRRIYPSDHVQKGIALECMAKALIEQGNSAGAEPLIHDAIALYRRLEGPDSLRVSRGLVNLARALFHDRSRVSESLRTLEDALAINRRHFGGKHADMVQNLAALANALTMTGNDTEAEARYAESIALGREVFGPDHPDVITPQVNLVTLYIRNNRLAEAEALAHQVHEAELRVFGPDNPRVLCHEQTLGEIRERVPDMAGAETYYRTALANAARIKAERHTTACIVRSNLAILLVDAGRLDDAQSLLEEQVSNAGMDAVLTRWFVFHAKSLLGEIQMARGRLAEAEPLLKEGADGLRTAAMVPARRRRRAMEQLIRCYDQLNVASPGAGYDTKAALLREQLVP